VSTIEGLIEHGDNALVVVGAGHLVGPDNLLQLLRTMGYTIEQITAHTGVATFSTQNPAQAPYIKSGMEKVKHAKAGHSGWNCCSYIINML